MTKSRELINTIVLLLVLGAAFSLYIGSQKRTSVNSPAFVYDEVIVKKQAMVETSASVKPINNVKIVTIPKPVNPVSVIPPIQPPRIISQVLPEYPVSALENEIEGVTLVQAYVGSSGIVDKTEIKTSSRNADLDASALKAVSQWTFSPALQGGSAIASQFEVPVRFSIK